MVTLLLTEKGGETKQLNFEKDEVTVGRVQGNDIVLPKGNVSKRHCRVMLQGGKFSVEDLKSTNGTYINGRKIGDVTPVVGTDKIYVGDFVIRVEVPGESTMPPPSASSAPEAGSLITALPRRPPPPPAPGRMTTTMAALDNLDDLPGRSPGRPAPPPPPARRESGVDAVSGPVTLSPEPLSAGSALPALSDPDDEVLSPRPRLQVPPLKSPRPLLSADEARTVDEDVLTGTRDRIPAAAKRSGVGHAPESVAPPEPDGAGATWLRELLASDGATAIYVSGGRVEIDRHGQRQSVTPPAGTGLAEAVRSLAARGTPRPAGDTRVVNVFLPENARLAAIFPPVAGELSATIERSLPSTQTLAELTSSGAISADTQNLLESCVAGRRNILIGGDGRALEALLQATANAIPAHMRVVALADLTPPQAATAWTRLSRDTHVPDLVRAAASLRPDYLVVDVTAPGMATDILSQSVLGQEGAIVAVAARSASDALGRLAALAGSALGGVEHARELAATAFDLVLCASTLADGSVRLLEVGEPRIGSAGAPEVVTAVAWRPDAGARGAGPGRFEVVGDLVRLGATLAARGVELPAGLLRL
jgi:pilus assembly protein CpaF